MILLLFGLRGQRQWYLYLSGQAIFCCENRKQTSKKKVQWHKPMKAYLLLMFHAHCNPAGFFPCSHPGTQNDKAATFLNNSRHTQGERAWKIMHWLLQLLIEVILTFDHSPPARVKECCFTLRLGEETGMLGKHHHAICGSLCLLS